MLRMVLAFVAGGLFGAGLHLSGMTDTSRVQGWLDLFGTWDPTLAFVMGGAMIPMAIAWQLAKRRNTALTGALMPPPPQTNIDRRLILGSVMFGVGWGLVGLCPGPAIAALGYGGTNVLFFAAAMITGMWLAPRISIRLDSVIPAE